MGNRTQSFRTTVDGNGFSVFEQHYQFYQARDVEISIIDTQAGNDVVHADSGYKFSPLMVTDLIHRYSFNETSGTVLSDSIGGAHATLVDIAGTTNTSGLGWKFSSKCSLRLFGGANTTSDYVEFPNTILAV